MSSLKAVSISFVIMLSMGCEKIELPEDINVNCVAAFADQPDPGEFGYATFLLNGEETRCVAEGQSRRPGTVDIKMHVFDETCYRTAKVRVTKLALDRSPYRIDTFWTRCDSFAPLGTVFDWERLIFSYQDHDAALAFYYVDPERSGYEARVTDYNAKRKIVKGVFSGDFIYDDSCWSNPLYAQDSLITITDGYFEVYLR